MVSITRRAASSAAFLIAAPPRRPSGPLVGRYPRSPPNFTPQAFAAASAAGAGADELALLLGECRVDVEHCLLTALTSSSNSRRGRPRALCQFLGRCAQGRGGGGPESRPASHSVAYMSGSTEPHEPHCYWQREPDRDEAPGSRRTTRQRGDWITNSTTVSPRAARRRFRTLAKFQASRA